MNAFVNGLNETKTDNGRKAYHSTTNFCLDLFYKIGASRGKDISSEISKAMEEDSMTALKILLWARDIRGGAGERENVRKALNEFAKMKYFSMDFAKNLVRAIVEVGRFDDLKAIFWGTLYEEIAANYWTAEIAKGNGLAAKWAPRKDKKGAKPLRSVTGTEMTEAKWRKFVVARTDVAEQKMCAGNWSAIDYNKLPSVASSMYRKAFSNHDADRYVSYLEALKRGDKGVKVNAGAIYPHTLVARRNEAISAEQWKALPDYVGDSKESFLPIVDSSGSMTCRIDSSGTRALDVAVGLGLYCAERNKSAFKDVVVTFAGNPRIHKLQKVGFKARVEEMSHLDWDMSTNIDRVYRAVLDHGIKYNVSSEEMPTKLLIISDMQFNSCIRGMEDLDYWRRKYESEGYAFPNIVFWNVNDRSGSIPVKADEKGTALVSGFSPSMVKNLLHGDLMPLEVMRKTLSDPRYDVSSYI